jgi:hypothetical protein
MARKKRLTPAEVVIDAFGIRPLATALGAAPTTIMRWRDSKTLAGDIPGKWHAPILELARIERRRDITAEVLVYGRAA